MKFAIGYKAFDDGGMVDLVRDYRDCVAEVYFPWVGAASGRAALGLRRGAVDWNAQARLEEELVALREMGIRLDLLFNANCYGARAVSQSLENEVVSILGHLDDVAGGVDTVTTTSLAVARTVKKHFPRVEVRASVNMRIGTVQAMDYVAGLFDSYYVQRDVQRDLAHVRRLKSWADAHGKGLFMLANSGCLYCCPGQTFHDNMVAHDRAIDETKNIEGWTPHVCWNLLRDPARRAAVLQSTWVRPEDLRHYDDLFPVVKLATRMHDHPRMVIHAYANRRHDGNLLDLFEPGFAAAFAPEMIANDKFPADWFARTSTCGRRCEECSYCGDVLSRVVTRAEET